MENRATRYVSIWLQKKYEEKDIFSNGFPPQDNTTIDHFYTRENGEFFFPGLRPANNYFLLIAPKKYFSSQYIQDIEVRKNETHFTEFTFDFLSRTGIKGIVTKNGIPLKSVYISIHTIPGRKDFGSIKTDKNGYYSILMVQPGLYNVEYTYFGQDEKKYEKEVKVKIESEKINIINIDF